MLVKQPYYNQLLDNFSKSIGKNQRFTATNRNNSCPICEKTNGNCRLTQDNGILCMTYADGYGASNHPVYRFTKPTKDGLWGIYYPRRDNDYDREKWELEKEIRKAQRKNEKKKRSKAALSTEEMDKALRKLHRYIGLTEKDREHLRDRGLTDEQINAGLFFSVSPNQEIPSGIPLNFPGIDSSGKKLICSGQGIACIAFDKDGRAIGYQIRLDGAESNKYRWGKSKTSSHLGNGELPLTITGPSLTDAEIVLLTEGILKPLVASQKWQIPCIGAAGGNHKGSQRQLRTALELLPDNALIAIPPDAGAIFNKNVLRQHESIIKLLTDWGYWDRVRFLWYGQVNKADGDIDEIDQATFDQIQYLTPDEWHEVINKQQWLKKVGEAQQKLTTLSYQPDIKFNRPYFPSLEEIQAIKALPEMGLFNLIGAKGTGKSTLIRALKQYYKSKGYNVLSITPRIALGRAQAFEWQINWISDIGADGVDLNFMARNTNELGLCFDSIHRLSDRDFEKTLVIFDESELGFNHLATSGTLKDKRSRALKMVETIITESLSNGGLVLLSDADLTDVSVNYIKSFAPADVPIFTIINEAKPKQWDIDFYSGGRLAGSLKEELFADIEEGLKPVVACDNQSEAEALDREIAAKFPTKKIVRIDRTTTETDAGRKFVENINQSILDEKPDILIHTGSMGTGCSIDGKIRDEETGKKYFSDEVYNHFDKVYGLFFGVVEPSQCRQYLARYRKPVPRVIWVKEAGFRDESCKSFLPDVIKRNLFKNTDQTLNIIEMAKELAGEDADDMAILQTLNAMMNPETGNWDNPHIDLYCQVKARRNYGLSQLAVQLRQELIEESHNLTDYSSDDKGKITARIKEAKQEIKFEKATAIATAPDITIEQARAIEKKATTTEGERNQAAKAFLKAELPEMEIDSDFIYDWIIKDNRKRLNAVKLFFLVQHPNIAKHLDKKEFRHRLKQFSNEALFLPDLKLYANQIKVLNDLDFLSYIDPNRKYRGTDEDLIELNQQAYFMRDRIYTTFGLKVTKKTEPMELLTRLASRLGIEFNKKQIREGNFRLYEFTIDIEKLQDSTRLAIINSLTIKYAEILTEQEIESVTQLPFYLTDQEKLSDKILPTDDSPTVLKREIKNEEINTNTDTWHNYSEGQKVWLWRYFEEQEIWLPATVKSITPSLSIKIKKMRY